MSFTAYPSYPALDLGLDQKDNDTYLSQLSSFLAGNSTAFGGELSSPELTSSSNGSSPESSAGANTAPASVPVESKSAQAKQPKPAAMAAADKRKQEDNTKSSANKDRRASTGESGAIAHTHDQIGSEDEDGDGTGKGKTSERRRQQNRQAQRAFRERKEKHLKELEDRVFSLEQQSQTQDSENSALKQLLQRLQSENERLKVFETAFSFTYQDAKNMPQSSQFKPPTPPTAQDEVDDLSSFSGAFSFGPSPAASNSSAYLASTSAAPSLFGSLSNSPNTSFPVNNSAVPAGASSSGLDTAAFFKQFSVPSPASTTGADSIASSSSLSAANTSVTTPPDDLFSAYRDPTANFGAPSLTSLNDLDSLFGTNPSPAGLDDFSAFLNSPSPSGATAAGAGASPSLGSLASVAGVSPGAGCPYGMDKEAFMKKTSEPFQFDLDNLCSDLKAKAVCQEAARAALAAAMAEDHGHTTSLESGFTSQ